MSSSKLKRTVFASSQAVVELLVTNDPTSPRLSSAGAADGLAR